MRGKSHADIGKMSFGESGEESEDEKKHAVPHQPTIGGVHGVAPLRLACGRCVRVAGVFITK
jgi:hypothetical protein